MIWSPDSLVVLCFAALMVWAAVADFRAYMIPNRICVAALCIYPAHVLTMWQAVNPMIWLIAIVLALAVFAWGVVLFKVGAMGGGDVKLMSLVALWAGPAEILPYFVVTAAAGLVLAGFIVLKTSTVAAQSRAGGGMTPATMVATITGIRHIPLSKLMIPYGVAIAAGGLYVAYRLQVA